MSKYKAKRTEVDGITFDSKREAARYQELKLWARSGGVRNIRCQVAYWLTVQDKKIGRYVADFVYQEYHPKHQSWSEVVEDCKGFRTPMYRWKKKHVEAQYGIQIRET